MFKSIKKNFLLIITLSFFLFPLLVNANTGWSTLQDNGANRGPLAAVGGASGGVAAFIRDDLFFVGFVHSISYAGVKIGTDVIMIPVSDNIIT